MPTGPKGQKRPADVIGNAVKVMRLATGKETEVRTEAGKNAAAVALRRMGGKAGCAVRGGGPPISSREVADCAVDRAQRAAARGPAFINKPPAN